MLGLGLLILFLLGRLPKGGIVFSEWDGSVSLRADKERKFVAGGVGPELVNFKRLDARPLWSRALVEKIFFSAGSLMSVDLFLFLSRVSS